MNKRDIKIYQSRYNDRLLKFGYSTKTLGWGGGRERQSLRFKTHLEIGFKENDSIIDIGCGFGDLYFYLKENFSQFYYYGIDINPILIEKGKEILEKSGLKISSASDLNDAAKKIVDEIK